MEINLQLTKRQIFLIQTVFDRLLFDHYLSCTDGNHDTDQAYEMQAAVFALYKQITQS